MRKPPLSMISAVVASLFSSNSRSTVSSCWTSSSMSWGSVAMSCVLRCGLADELIEQHAGDHVESFEHPFAHMGGRAEGRHLHFAVVQQKLTIIHRRGSRQIARVILPDI